MKTVLTDEEIDAIWPAPEGTNSMLMYARAIEAAVLAKFGEPVAWEWIEAEKGMQISHNEPPEYEVFKVQPLYSLKDKP